MQVRMCSRGKTKKMIERGTQFIEFVAETKEETEILRTLIHGHSENGVLQGRYRMHSFGYDRKMSKYSHKRTPEEWSKILDDGAKRQVLTFEEIPTS